MTYFENFTEIIQCSLEAPRNLLKFPPESILWNVSKNFTINCSMNICRGFSSSFRRLHQKYFFFSKCFSVVLLRIFPSCILFLQDLLKKFLQVVLRGFSVLTLSKIKKKVLNFSRGISSSSYKYSYRKSSRDPSEIQ